MNSPIAPNNVVMTAKGGPIEIDDELRAVVCYFANGRMLVNLDHQFNPHVVGLAARLRRRNLPVSVETVDIAKIREAYNQHEGSLSIKNGASKKQFDALELFKRGVSLRTSDIHIRVSKRNDTEIRFRIHGDLEIDSKASYEEGVLMCTAIYQSMCDVSDAQFDPSSRQDARIGAKDKMPPGIEGIRVATTPQVDGFVMVLRILYNSTGSGHNLDQLGFTETQQQSINFLTRRPYGINIISGPTGSGKSTTLQCVLGGIASRGKGKDHIITVEDPPEYTILDAVQTPVANADTPELRSLAFQAAIKATMRLDPDVIMVGEMRDLPSVQLAIEAAMTGHQVWTTLHANGAFATLDRMINVGLSKDLAYDPNVITGLISQRLVKRLCPHCKIPFLEAEGHTSYKQADLDRLLSVIDVRQAFVVNEDGCPHCRKGVIGSIAVSEIVVTDEHLMDLLRRGDRLAALDYWRESQKGKTLLENTIDKVNEGVVDPIQAESMVGPLLLAEATRDHRIDQGEIKKSQSIYTG